MTCNIETAFSPMFAIQLAAFLMTLVRKAIISEWTGTEFMQYHFG